MITIMNEGGVVLKECEDRPAALEWIKEAGLVWVAEEQSMLAKKKYIIVKGAC